jgi:hypothetical protein
MTVMVLARACGQCGAMFTPRRSDARFCGDACRTAHGRVIRSERSDNRIRSVIRSEPRSDNRTPEAVLVWDPPSELRKPCPGTEPCPRCAAPLWATPRATGRACLACRRPVIPPGVMAPYARDGEPARQVRSTAERDAASKALRIRRGVLSRQLRALLDQDLTGESADLAGWYLDEVGEAKSMGRLDELVGEFEAERIRPRRWWHGTPAIEAPEYEDDDGGQADDDGGYALAAGAVPAACDPVAEMSARGYLIAAGGPAGSCPIAETHTGATVRCGGQAGAVFGGQRICASHHAALTAGAVA